MRSKKKFIRENYKQMALSFLMPAFVLFCVYFSIGIYWGSTRSVLASDAFSQFSNFHAALHNVLHGKQGLLYSWNASMGLNFLSLYSYYLGGIFSPLVFFFRNENIPNALYLLTLLKVGSAGLSMWFLLKNVLKNMNAWGILALSVPYPLMSFAMAQSEIIMWLDAYVWLPLVILGIHFVLEKKGRKLLFFSYFFLFVSNFYMGYMVGIFSFLYFWVQVFAHFSKNLSQSRFRGDFVINLCVFLGRFLRNQVRAIGIIADSHEKNADLVGLNRGFLTKKRANLAKIDRNRQLQTGSKVRKCIWDYLSTSFLAGVASLVLLLPVIVDLRENGEELSKITHLKTEATGAWDFFMKNFLASYDGTKYGSIPFIYVGLLPLLFFFLYFMLKRISLREKIGFAVLSAFLLSSFYLQPLNLFWQGFHSPNMFLFRFSYLFSFLVLLLASFALDGLTRGEMPKFFIVTLLLIAGFATAYFFAHKQYAFVKSEMVVVTFVFLLLYLVAFYLFQANCYKITPFMFLLFLLMSLEAAVNTKGEIEGILDDWNYASASVYASPQTYLSNLVKTTFKTTDGFYRMENLTPVSTNDSLNYGYSGISFFSSVRNRHSSHFLDALGFKSAGTNLNIRYLNNTLLMDAFASIKYNISDHLIAKYGFSEIKQSGVYHLYQNKNALSLATLTTKNVLDFTLKPNDNIWNQTKLMNALSEKNLTYFHFETPTLLEKKNVVVTSNSDGTVHLKEQISNVVKTLTYKVTAKANTQCYLSLFPTNTSEIGSSNVSVKVNGVENNAQLDITGQYYPIGYFPKEQTLSVEVTFSGSSSVTLLAPQILVLDVANFQEAIDALKKKEPEVHVQNRTVTIQAKAENEQALIYTTIPYDLGWRVKVNGQTAKTEKAQDAFLAVRVPKGEDTIVFQYFPYGLREGIVLFFLANTLFWSREWINWRKYSKIERESNKT